MKQLFPATGLALTLFLETVPAIAQHSHPSSLPKTTTAHMNTAQQNKHIIRQLFETVINQRKFNELPAYISDSYTGPSGVKGPAGFEAPIAPLIQAFPDIQWQLQELIAEGDQVVVKWRWGGDTNDAMAIYTLKDGKVVKGQLQNDRLGSLQALGQLPADIALISGTHKKPAGIEHMNQLIVPAAAKAAFLERMRINRDILRALPGFMEDAAYSRTLPNGDTEFVTIVRWQDDAALKAAKNALQLANEKEGFDLTAFREKLGIRPVPGLFEKLEDNSAGHAAEKE